MVDVRFAGVRVRGLTGALALTSLLGCSAPDVTSGTADAPGRRPVAVPATPAPSPSPSPRPGASRAPEPTAAPVVVQRGSGELVTVPGGSATVGRGPLQTYAVEVEGGLGVDPVAFARAVDRTLADPRSWTAGQRRALRRVDGPADLRVTLASPVTVDRLCAPLRTVGRWSCANGDRAVLNAARWLTGVPAYGGDLPAYRAYLVNHEVGHVLGSSHASCPGRGQVAPVMLQQSLGLDGCLPGPWPYPR